MINNIRKNYKSYADKKKENAIKLLYDKSEMKAAKNEKKATKEYKQMDFSTNRKNYYKKKPDTYLNCS